MSQFVLPSTNPDLDPAEEEPLDLGELFISLHQPLTGMPAPEYEIRFYPYAGLKHTIRTRNGKVLIRLSDLVREASSLVLEATIGLLICRLHSIPAPENLQSRYSSFATSPEIRSASLQARSERGSKRLSKAQGTYHDLKGLFSKLNREYFGNQLQVRHLSWSPGRSRRVLGHYDRAHDAIILNRHLDQPLVPGYVVEYVLYHEMLHAALGEEMGGLRRRIHHRRFRRAELEFVDYSRARRFINEELC